MTSPTLPTLDIANFLLNSKSDAANTFVTKLARVCHDPGFFYLVGHGIPETMDNDIMEIAEQFFALPADQRNRIAIGQSPHFRGYTILGDEMTQGKNDWRDQLDIGPEEPAVSAGKDDPAWLRLRGPNQWPESLPQMQNIVTAWMEQIEGLCQSLIQALALGLGLDQNYFTDRMSPDPYTRLKIAHYPEQPETKEPAQELTQGLGLHHDSGLFTLILQDSTPGLQVEIDGKLQTIEPRNGAYVVNLGEMFQAATNGYLRATKHRVQSPPAGKQRISIAYFMNPRLDAVFEPIKLPLHLAALATGSQNENPDDIVYPVFGDNTLKIRMRAHPDVANRFYSDLL
jgi:isopenicillin N synthase-like dioxygenase